MIYIRKGQMNRIPLTLQEQALTAYPFYLMKFMPEFDENAEPVFFMSPDVSGYPERINIFELNEGVGGDLDLIKGQYSYTVYESLVNTLDVGQTTGNIVESGRMVVANDIDERTQLDVGGDSVYN